MSAKQHPDPNVLCPQQTQQIFRNVFQIFFHTQIGKSTMTFLTSHYHGMYSNPGVEPRTKILVLFHRQTLPEFWFIGFVAQAS